MPGLRIDGLRNRIRLGNNQVRMGSDGPALANAAATALLNADGGLEVDRAAAYEDAGSFQAMAADLELDADAGKDAGDSAFLAAGMFNLLGDALTKTANYLAGVIGAYSVTDAKAGELQAGAVIGIAMDGVSDADGVVVAVIDGSDPSTETRVNAMFAARMNNNDAGSGADFGLDLHDAGRSSDYYTGGGTALAYAKADIRLAGAVCILQGAGAPSNGTTGDDVAAKGSLYIDTTNGVLYINTGAIDNPTWTKVGTQS